MIFKKRVKAESDSEHSEVSTTTRVVINSSHLEKYIVSKDEVFATTGTSIARPQSFFAPKTHVLYSRRQQTPSILYIFLY